MRSFDTPILYLFFNRPAEAKITFQRIREIRPTKLFLAADGPRANNDEDKVECERARKTVLSMIDWDCELKTLFRETNLGCGPAVGSAITWFFTQVEEGIILEDDCLPIPFFFTYAQELLNRYRDHKNIMHISGNNFNTEIRSTYDVIFSRIPHSWGWATWRDRWQLYSSDFHGASENFNLDTFGFLDKTEKRYWADTFAKTKLSIISAWDYQWTYTLWVNNGLSVIPKYNLVTNIGFEGKATNTTIRDDRFKHIITQPYTLESLPKEILPNPHFDKIFFRTYLKTRFSFRNWIKKQLR